MTNLRESIKDEIMKELPGADRGGITFYWDSMSGEWRIINAKVCGRDFCFQYNEKTGELRMDVYTHSVHKQKNIGGNLN